MNELPDANLQVGDRVTLRKPHPCGGHAWDVTRIGADIGLRCATCGRRIMLARATLRKRLTAIDPGGGGS